MTIQINPQKNQSKIGRAKKTISTERYKPSDVFHRYNIVLYGVEKIGKTTLTLGFPETYHFLFDANDSYELLGNFITCWEDFEDYVDSFLESSHHTAVIDSVGQRAKQIYLNYLKNTTGFDNPTAAKDFGATWDRAKMEFSRPFYKLLLNTTEHKKNGCIIIMHSTTEEKETLTGKTFSYIKPYSSSYSDFLLKEVYNIFYYHMVGNDRFLRIEGSEYIRAGHRMEGHFLTPDGKRIIQVPMGKSRQEAYENLLNAYSNKQIDTFENL
jgi:hypothetical protein